MQEQGPILLRHDLILTNFTCCDRISKKVHILRFWEAHGHGVQILARLLTSSLTLSKLLALSGHLCSHVQGEDESTNPTGLL